MTEAGWNNNAVEITSHTHPHVYEMKRLICRTVPASNLTRFNCCTFLFTVPHCWRSNYHMLSLVNHSCIEYLLVKEFVGFVVLLAIPLSLFVQYKNQNAEYPNTNGSEATDQANRDDINSKHSDIWNSLVPTGLAKNPLSAIPRANEVSRCQRDCPSTNGRLVFFFPFCIFCLPLFVKHQCALFSLGGSQPTEGC